MDLKEKRLSGKTIYDGKVIKVTCDDVLCPNGNISKREIVHHNGGSAILCINDKEEVLLIKQYRYAYDEVIYEIPAGKLEVGEDPYDAAIRELEEETANKADSLKYLGIIYPSCGYTNEKIHLYLANNTKITKTNFDEDEYIVSEYYPLSTVIEMIKDGTIKDAKTICAINYYIINK